MEQRRWEAVPLEQSGEGNLFPVLGLLGKSGFCWVCGKRLGLLVWEIWVLLGG